MTTLGIRQSFSDYLTFPLSHQLFILFSTKTQHLIRLFEKADPVEIKDYCFQRVTLTSVRAEAEGTNQRP